MNLSQERIEDMRFLNWISERCGKPPPYPEFPYIPPPRPCLKARKP